MYEVMPNPFELRVQAACSYGDAVSVTHAQVRATPVGERVARVQDSNQAVSVSAAMTVLSRDETETVVRVRTREWGALDRTRDWHYRVPAGEAAHA